MILKISNPFKLRIFYHILQQLINLVHDQWTNRSKSNFLKQWSNIRVNVMSFFPPSLYIWKNQKKRLTNYISCIYIFYSSSLNSKMIIPQFIIYQNFRSSNTSQISFLISISWKYQFSKHHLITNDHVSSLKHGLQQLKIMCWRIVFVWCTWRQK
jgi:hypothetical protein